MGAIKGTLTYSTYYVLDDPDEGFKQILVESLGSYAFRGIDVEAGQDQAVGWVAVDDPFDTTFSWESVYMDPYICFSLRIDRVKVPPVVLKAHLGQREREVLAESGKETLGRSERAALKQDVLLNLRRRALPDIRMYDVIWSPQNASLRFWSHSARTKEGFEELFHRSFGLRLLPCSPYTMALRNTKEPDKMAAAVLDLAPANLVLGEQ